MEWKQFEGYGEKMLQYIAAYRDSIPSRPVFPDVKPGFMRQLLPDKAPEDPDSWQDIMEDVERIIMPGVTHGQSPKFFGFFRLGSSYPSLLADMLCDGIGAVQMNWASCPSCTELEVVMMDWLAKMLHLPPSFLFSSPGNGGGCIQGSASEATLVSLLAARTLFFENEKKVNAHVTLGQVVDRLVAYCSEQAHVCVDRAGLIGGVHVRKLETDEKGALRGDTLKAAILEDKAKGLLPFFLCATLGSTSMCAFDNVKELGPVCQEHEIWMHIDAAFAGAAFICPEFLYLSEGVELASSFNFNPHKWLKVRVHCSTLWLQNTDYLRYAFDVHAPYLKHHNEGDMPDFWHWQIPLGTRFRALRIWFVLRLFGLKRLQESIRQDVHLAQEFEALMRSDPKFEIVNNVIMSLVCFRLKGPNSLTERLLKQLQIDKKIFVVPSCVKGMYFIRLTITCPDCKSSDIKHAWDVIREAADLVLNCNDVEPISMQNGL